MKHTACLFLTITLVFAALVGCAKPEIEEIPEEQGEIADIRTEEPEVGEEVVETDESEPENNQGEEQQEEITEEEAINIVKNHYERDNAIFDPKKATDEELFYRVDSTIGLVSSGEYYYSVGIYYTPDINSEEPSIMVYNVNILTGELRYYVRQTGAQIIEAEAILETLSPNEIEKEMPEIIKEVESLVSVKNHFIENNEMAEELYFRIDPFMSDEERYVVQVYGVWWVPDTNSGMTNTRNWYYVYKLTGDLEVWI